MTRDHKDEELQESKESTPEESEREEVSEEETGEQENEKLRQELSDLNDKYLRLYADFENYKKIAARNKEELLKYANEEIITDILTVIDHLELALQHASENSSTDALAEGVNLTLKELKNVLEKYGLVTIDALGKQFDPAIHHAMSQIESEDAEENTVIKEFRKGYMLKDRVLRAALVGVAKKQGSHGNEDAADIKDEKVESEEK